MKRFENAQVGDKVYSKLHGLGEIMYIDKFILKCRFDIKNHQIDSEYLLDGKCFENDIEPTLFYSDCINNYLTERPEPEIDWFKVPMGTKVVTANHPIINNNNDYIEFFMGYFPELDDPFWTFNDMHRDSAAGFKHCKLAEPCKPEWRNNGTI